MDSARLRRMWHSRRWPAWAWLPLAWLYGALAWLPRWAYRCGWRQAEHAGIPTLVIGNVVAGGAGKTPVTLATVQHLQARGWRPGIVARGYGRHLNDCRAVHPDSEACAVGDEPLLLARASGVPVYVAPQRIAAARALRAAHPEVNILLCDDGLQHHALARDLDICVFHDQGIGNGWLLPAGPLREAWPRPVDAILYAGPCPPLPSPSTPHFAVQRRLAPYALSADGTRIPLHTLQHQPVHAIAAIARPEDFFAMLRSQGLHLAHTEGLPDHFDFKSWKRLSSKGKTLICTEKDATKLWPLHPDALAVPLCLDIDPAYIQWLDGQLRRLSLNATPTSP